MTKIFKKLAMVGMALAVGVAGLVNFSTPPAEAQGYFTNNGTIYGAQTYNQNLPSIYNPSVTIQKQIADGIMAGVFTNIGGGFAAVTNTYLAQFGVYTNYSIPPAAFLQAVNPSPAGNTNPAVVLFTTTTNFAVYFGANSNLSYSLMFVGH